MLAIRTVRRQCLGLDRRRRLLNDLAPYLLSLLRGLEFVGPLIDTMWDDPRLKSGGQLTLCVTNAEADQIISQRSEQGFLKSTVVAKPDVGVFYAIQLIPGP